MSSSGRGFLRGRPRRRFWLSTLPLRNSSPPQTPHGSRRSSAPCKQGVTREQVLQMRLARTMSGICSEKNSSVSPPALVAAAGVSPRVGRLVGGDQLLAKLDGEHFAVSFRRGPCSGEVGK